MTPAKYSAVVAQIGQPDRTAQRNVPAIPPGAISSYASGAAAQTGTMQTINITTSGVYTLTAIGAAGMLGSYIYTGPVEYVSNPGKGAKVTTDVYLAAGDELLVLVGKRGVTTAVVTTDGCSGGGGGGTFVFRKIAAITDSRYQITLNGYAYECLLVAAGGGGTQDNAYRRSTVDGYDAAEQLYSLANFKAFSTTTRTPTLSGGVSSPMGLSQIASYAGRGSFYLHNSNYGYGGYGCGGSQDDGFTYGGGWSTSAVSYRSASWAKEGGTLSIMADIDTGSFTLQRIGDEEQFGWWKPIYDRTAADCIYGTAKGCIDQLMLNRIEADIDFVMFYYSLYNVAHTTLSEIDAVWYRTLYLKYASMLRIYNNLVYLWEAPILPTDAVAVIPVVANSGIAHTVMNNWEKTLADIIELLDGMVSIMRISGTFTSGSDVHTQQIRR